MDTFSEGEGGGRYTEKKKTDRQTERQTGNAQTKTIKQEDFVFARGFEST